MSKDNRSEIDLSKIVWEKIDDGEPRFGKIKFDKPESDSEYLRRILKMSPAERKFLTNFTAELRDLADVLEARYKLDEIEKE